MTLCFDLFWSFRSPYSYLATRRVVELVDTYDVEVRVRIVLPIAVRTPEFFDRVNPLWPRYLLIDTQRIAEMEGLPYHWPRPDPVVHDVERGVIAAHQPHIGPLSRLGVAAAESGRGLAFIDQVSQLIWSGRLRGWDQGDHLQRAAEQAGLVWAELERALAQDEARLDGELDRNAADLEASGHWGVPTAVFEGEPFFGQDRLALLEWRMKQKGLEPRTG